MSIKLQHISGMRFQVSGNVYKEDGTPNKSVLAILYIYDPIVKVYVELRDTTEVVRTTTDEYGEFIFIRTFIPGDYVIKFYGTGIPRKQQTSIDWEFFTILPESVFDVTGPDGTEIFQMNYNYYPQEKTDRGLS